MQETHELPFDWNRSNRLQNFYTLNEHSKEAYFPTMLDTKRESAN